MAKRRQAPGLCTGPLGWLPSGRPAKTISPPSQETSGALTSISSKVSGRGSEPSISVRRLPSGSRTRSLPGAATRKRLYTPTPGMSFGTDQ